MPFKSPRAKIMLINVFLSDKEFKTHKYPIFYYVEPKKKKKSVNFFIREV